MHVPSCMSNALMHEHTHAPTYEHTHVSIGDLRRTRRVRRMSTYVLCYSHNSLARKLPVLK